MGQARHVLFSLGYQELTRVTCGTGATKKEALFFGGHDNVDIFVQCLCVQCAKRKPIAADDGGSIFNCCQFEKHAGLGHRKKWKESIRQADNGKRILDLIKDRSAVLGGDAFVGKCVWVCWLREGTFYQGLVRAWDQKEGKYHVQYADGDEEKLYLGIELLRVAGDVAPAWAARLPARPPPRAADKQHQPVPKRARASAKADGDNGYTLTLGPRRQRAQPGTDLTAPGGDTFIERLPRVCAPGRDGEVSAYATMAFGYRAAAYASYGHLPRAGGFDVLNLDQLTKQYPAMQPHLLRFDVSRWFGMSEAQRVAHLSGLLELRAVQERGAGDAACQRAFLGKAQYQCDLLGEVGGVVRVSGELAAECGGLPARARVFECSTRGQHCWPQELSLDSRCSSNPLSHVKQVVPASKAQANVAVAEVERHLPPEQGGGSTLHQLLFVLSDLQPGTQLVACANKSWVMADRPTVDPQRHAASAAAAAAAATATTTDAAASESLPPQQHMVATASDNGVGPMEVDTAAATGSDGGDAGADGSRPAAGDGCEAGGQQQGPASRPGGAGGDKTTADGSRDGQGSQDGQAQPGDEGHGCASSGTT